MTPSERSHFIKTRALELGFSACGISRATLLESEAPHLESWLKNNMHGEMAYMAGYFDLRLDPRKLMNNAKSVISVLKNYYTPARQQDPQAPKISRYAYGKDYHFIMKKKLSLLLDSIRERLGAVAGRGFVDSAPVLERAWAARCGLGWIGKNSNLLTQKGSFFFIGELIIDLDLEYDAPGADFCGRCSRCIQACPTAAIVAPRLVDARKCISYLTIEQPGELLKAVPGQLKNWLFGCDICQEVCPWNRFARSHHEPEFEPHPALLAMKKTDWQDISRDTFNELFRHSAVKRIKYEALIRNIGFLHFSGPGSKDL